MKFSRQRAQPLGFDVAGQNVFIETRDDSGSRCSLVQGRVGADQFRPFPITGDKPGRRSFVSPNGRVVTSGGTVATYNAAAERYVQSAETEKAFAPVVSSPDGKVLLCLFGWPRGWELWDAETGKLIRRFECDIGSAYYR